MKANYIKIKWFEKNFLISFYVLWNVNMKKRRTEKSLAKGLFFNLYE